MVVVNNKIKEFRKRAGLTQIALAQLLGIREKTVCYWETGRLEPHIEQAVDIARILSVNPEKIFPGMFGVGVDEVECPATDKNVKASIMIRR